MRAKRKIITDNGAGTNVARMAGEERHLQILRVAMRLFSQHGFRGTTTKEIALAAGVSEAMVFDALNHHEQDPEFQRLLLHSALEEHELAQMFWKKFVHRVYQSLGDYIRERQREGAMVQIKPAIIVRAFVGMIVHHSLNNNLWDRERRLLNISNETAAREFTNILLHGVVADKTIAQAAFRKLSSSRAALKTGASKRTARKQVDPNSRRIRSNK